MQQRILRAACLAVGLMVTALVTANSAQAERRVALVIGNGTYSKVAPLPNPPNDAKAMSALLRSLNFNVVTGSNLTREGMSETLRKFAAEAQGADVALFFYAGHGLQLDGKNYLLPIDANLSSESDVKLGGYTDLDTMLQLTMSEAKVKLVMLDACRDNPFVTQIARSARATRSVAVSPGLAEMKSGEGTLLAFATGPGQVALDGDGGNSPFTRALLDNLTKPGLEIRMALTHVRADVVDRTRKQQTPWENTNLTGFFYMNPVDAAATAPVTPSAPTHVMQPASAEVELEFWRSVRDSKNSEELNAYLIRYPNGSFASIARSRIAEIQVAKVEPAVSTRAVSAVASIDPELLRTSESTRATEDAIGLDVKQRRLVERRLNALGFASGALDGKFDEATRRALRNWQSARSYNVGGYLNKVQYEALQAEPVAAAVLADEEPKQRRGSSGGGHRPGGMDPGAAAAIGFIGGAIVGGAFRR